MVQEMGAGSRRRQLRSTIGTVALEGKMQPDIIGILLLLGIIGAIWWTAWGDVSN
jgi:hypothetical protein